jgi:nicotinamide-nucleotide amidase
MLSDAAPLPELLDRAQRVMRQVCARGWSVCTAESCTGGLLAALLTDIEGCSHAFDRGFVAYTEKAKTDLLGVDAQLLRERGAVSRAVAIAMAEGALRRSEADVALAVTGFAGPTDTPGEEGTVHLALARRDRATWALAREFGPRGRDAIRQLSLAALLDMLEEALRQP